jgi:LmbE family N-acetylglucosaminyl deacetylase
MSLSLILLSFFSFSALAKQKTILVVVPHPDDETAVDSVLAKYARLGNKVVLVIATDGKYGTRVTKIPEGDVLGQLRQKESVCAAEKLGIEPPIFFSIDRLDTRNGVRPYFNNHKKFRDLLKEKLIELKPDAIIAFGPDGDTHHSEHIVVGAAVTEILLSEGWVDKFPLYYMAFSKLPDDTEELGYVHEQYFNLKVDYSQEDENKAVAAYKCYETQFTPEEMQQEMNRRIKDKSNAAYFRRFYVKKRLQKDF